MVYLFICRMNLEKSMDKITAHPHLPANVNRLVEIEQEKASINEKIAIFVTNLLGNMWTAYFFLFLAIVGFPVNNPTPQAIVQWFSTTCIQLVALSVLALGQTIQNRHSELKAEQSFKMDMKNTHDNNMQIEMLNDIRTEMENYKKILLSIHTNMDKIIASGKK